MQWGWKDHRLLSTLPAATGQPEPSAPGGFSSQQLVAMVVSRAASLSMDVSDKKQL